MRITLVHNPGAGSSDKKAPRKLEKMLTRAGHDVRYVSSKEDGWKGALKKRADLVVLSADPRAVPPEEIGELEVVETFSRGRSVHSLGDAGR